jgi:hypothetical protein
MALPECSDLRDHQNKFKNPDEDDCSFFKDTRTGQRFPTRGSQNEIKEGRLKKLYGFNYKAKNP